MGKVTRQQIDFFIDLGRHAKLYPRNRSYVGLLKSFILSHGDPGIERALLGMVTASGNLPQKLISEKFTLPFSQEEFDGEIRLGIVADTNIIFMIPVESLTMHIILWARPGFGKSVFIKNIVRQIVNLPAENGEHREEEL